MLELFDSIIIGSNIAPDTYLLCLLGAGLCGVITAVVGVDMQNRTILSGPEIISRGFVFVREAEELMTELKALTLETMENCLDKGMTSRNAIKDAIARRLSDYLYKKTKREPLIVPILMEL